MNSNTDLNSSEVVATLLSEILVELRTMTAALKKAEPLLNSPAVKIASKLKGFPGLKG